MMFQTGGQGGLDARLDAVLSGAPAGVLEWRVLGRGAEAPPLGATRSAEARTDCLSTVRAAGRPLRSCVGNGMALAIVFRSVGVACRRRRIGRYAGRGQRGLMVTSPAEIWSSVTLIPPASKAARNGFGPRNCPKPSLLGAVYVSSAASGRPIGNEIPGISTRVTCRVTFRVTSVRIMGGTEGRSSWRCKGGTR